MRVLLTTLIFACLVGHGAQAAETDFKTWLALYKREAIAQGISEQSVNRALGKLNAPIESVIKLDRNQPEFVQTFSVYIDKRINAKRVNRGQEMQAKYADLLNSLEQQFGVPKNILLAFWGLETNYGSFKGDYAVPAVLATLAYEGRREAFFKSQLTEALQIIDAGHVSAENMLGSWAGAMGHMQFMPSTFNQYGLDGDDDGRVDVWNSIPDVMNSAANYLKSVGWKANEPIVMAVSLPETFDWSTAQLQNKLPLAQWQAQGVKALNGELPNTASNTAIILPQGWQGPAFMVFDNFEVIMHWNRSINYALAVSDLAGRIAGNPPLANKLNLDETALSFDQMKQIQQLLLDKGYTLGNADGIPGVQTQKAIRQFQKEAHLPTDGYASLDLLRYMQKTQNNATNVTKTNDNTTSTNATQPVNP